MIVKAHTVKSLIEALQKLPQDLPVVVPEYEGGLVLVHDIDIINLKVDGISRNWHEEDDFDKTAIKSIKIS